MKPFIAALVVFASNLACAQSAIYVNVKTETQDAVGMTLAYELREQIRGSKGLKLAIANEALLSVHLMTIDPMPASYNNLSSTAYSVVYTMETVDAKEAYLGSKIGTCGTSKLKECASRIVAEIDLIAVAMAESIKKVLDKPIKDRK